MIRLSIGLFASIVMVIGSFAYGDLLYRASQAGVSTSVIVPYAIIDVMLFGVAIGLGYTTTWWYKNR